MAQKNNEEIDLGMIFDKMRDLYHDFLIFLYGVFKFILKSWIILLILILGGIIYGYIKDSNPEKERETTLLVQINGDAVNYVYDAVEQFRFKLKEKDTVFLEKMGFFKNQFYYVQGVEIEPIVNVIDIIDKTEVNDRNLEIIVDQAQYEDELLKSDVFIPEYKYHRIKLTTSYWTGQTYIDRFMDYLNENEIFNRNKEVEKKNLKYRIDRSYESVAFMDSIFKTYAKPVSDISRSQQDKISLVDINITNIHMVFQEKALLMEQIQKLELEYANFEDTVELVNKPFLSIKRTTLDKKMLVYPIFFVFLFFVFSIVRYYFIKGKRLSMEKANNE